MSTLYILQPMDPVFLAALAAEPELRSLWKFDLGEQPRDFIRAPQVKEIARRTPIGKPCSSSEYVSLEMFLPGCIWLLGRSQPEELTAWRALNGEPDHEYAVVGFAGEPMHGFGPTAVRRLAVQIDAASLRCDDAFDASALIADNIYPWSWNEPWARPGVKSALATLRRTMVAAAEKNLAVLVSYG